MFPNLKREVEFLQARIDLINESLDFFKEISHKFEPGEWFVSKKFFLTLALLTNEKERVNLTFHFSLKKKEIIRYGVRSHYNNEEFLTREEALQFLLDWN